VAEEAKGKVNWFGNQGWLCPEQGKMKTADCGICGSPMNVKRNVLGPTSWIESMGRGEHLHDSFTCPNFEEDWHEKIVKLKSEARNTASDKIKKILEEEVIEILEAKAVR